MAVNALWWLAGGLIIVLLAGYALWLWRQVWAKQHLAEQTAQAREQRISGDLRVLADCLINQQVPFVEGCIRIKVMLDHHLPDASLQPSWQVFQQVFAATEHIPTHAAWKALSKAQRRDYQQLFTELEQQHRSAAEQAARELLQRH